MNSCQEFQREYADVDNYKVITNRTVLMKEQIVDLEKSILNDSIHQITDAFHDLSVYYDDLCDSIIALSEIKVAIAQSPAKVNNKIKKQFNSRTLVADFFYKPRANGFKQIDLLIEKRRNLKKVLNLFGIDDEIVDLFLSDYFIIHNKTLSFDKYFINASVIECLFLLRLEQERLLNLNLIIIHGSNHYSRFIQE